MKHTLIKVTDNDTVLVRRTRAKWPSKGGLKNLKESMHKLRAIQELLQICIFKIFFNHSDGNIEEMSQMEGHSEKMYFFKIFFNHGEGNIEEMSRMESHSEAS